MNFLNLLLHSLQAFSLRTEKIFFLRYLMCDAIFKGTVILDITVTFDVSSVRGSLECGRCSAGCCVNLVIPHTCRWPSDLVRRCGLRMCSAPHRCAGGRRQRDRRKLQSSFAIRTFLNSGICFDACDHPIAGARRV
jgi:hypothetical protein